MDLYRVGNSKELDYNMDNRDSKHGKVLPCTEDRIDSGLDSLKEEEYNGIVNEMERLKMDPAEATADYCNEPWKLEMTEDGDTLLHLAIIHEATDYAIRMIEHSRNDPFLNTQNNQRQTPLHLAVIMEQPQIVDRLLKAGCDPRMVDECGNTALHIACKKGSLHCFSVLTQGCTQLLPSILATTNYGGHNCLHLVSIHGFLSLVERLIELGADINAQEQCNGRTPLHLAVDLQNLDLVQLLISKGANVNSLTYGGYTPYHLTYGRQNMEIQQHLFELTAQELRDLPESEDEESEEEPQSEDDDMYDDFLWMGQK
ncbi:nuclear factor of kappa light polypeptide gene enhancer in B-cells inhibitor, alpha b [Megalops cyprinoides]|uniref:nuclear factor of kappa light polypeptide gene enhancer in B-cells inhibitor, alpha b n=1 Tax=Megalops cyprinoides TaxID=118141 RepID=UPI001864F185|nr:nuclear factor of kappa light polypeptide gene enhancer in B-cells inhibitor, alpha b [Megalops cyprinoides]